MANKILIVDDDPVLLNLLGNYISYFGLEFSTASDGQDAVEKLKKETFSVVITDMMMPKMDGMQLLQHIRSIYPQTNVIVVTGYDRTFTYTDVIKAGASDFIIKPFNSAELEAKINRILREQEMVSRLEFVSNCDPLTELFNRRYLDKKIKEEVRRSDRQGYSVFLIMLDVDSFKQYNDDHGHPEGDKLLIKVAKILKRCTRADVDLVFRHGGDEFSIMAPCRNLGFRGVYGKCKTAHVLLRIPLT